MTDEECQAELSSLRAELSTVVAAAAERDYQLRAELHERFVETAELTRLLLAAEKRATVAKKRLSTAQTRIATLEEEAGVPILVRIRRALRRRLSKAMGRG